MDALNEETYYRATAPGFSAPIFQGAQNVDVGIIGAGFAGLGTALSLAERGQTSIALLEGQSIGYGASGRNGGFVFGGFSLSNRDLVKKIGQDEANALYQGTIAAISIIRERAKRYNIDCDINESGVLLANWFDDERRLTSIQRYMQEMYKVEWDLLDKVETRNLLRTERYFGALLEKNAFHFHPLKYAQGCAVQLQKMGVFIYENSPAITIEKHVAGYIVTTPQGKLFCKALVVTCGGYIETLNSELAQAVMPIATYVMVTQPLGEQLTRCIDTPCAVYDSRFAFDYYRPLSDGRLLWGGRISVRDRSSHEISLRLRRDLGKVFPSLANVNIDYAWSGLMSYATHQMPQIGQTAQGLWYGMGFGGHGVGPTTYAGEVLAKALVGEERVPSGFGHFGLNKTYGKLGLIGAQSTYWWLQAKDWWHQ